MKFIFFNLAVVAALIYLFQAERSDFHAAADRAYDAVDGVHALTQDAVRKGNRLLKDTEAPAADPDAAVPPMPGTAEAVPAPPPATAPVAAKATPPTDTAPQVANVAAQGAPPLGNPAVARRRTEVLGAVDGQPALAEGTALMAPEERRRQLFSLAEDMEFIFVKRIAR
jgi:hypothetical protein